MRRNRSAVTTLAGNESSFFYLFIFCLKIEPFDKFRSVGDRGGRWSLGMKEEGRGGGLWFRKRGRGEEIG